MKALFFLLLCSAGCLAQDSSKIGLTHLSFELGPEQIWHGAQTADELSNIVHNQSVMVHLDSSLNLRYNAYRYQFISYGINVGFKKDQSKLRYVVGFSADSRGDRYYSYRKEDIFRLDTVYQDYQNSGQIDTLFKDSVGVHTLNYSLRSSTAFSRFEVLRDFNKGLLKFSTGVGLMIGASISSYVVSTYSRRYHYVLSNQQEGIVYEGPSTTVVPDHGPQPSVGSLNSTNRSEVNGRLILKPYLPLYFKVCFGKNNFWKHLALAFNARVGAEFQIIKNEGVNPRLFFSQHLAFIYNI